MWLRISDSEGCRRCCSAGRFGLSSYHGSLKEDLDGQETSTSSSPELLSRNSKNDTRTFWHVELASVDYGCTTVAGSSMYGP